MKENSGDNRTALAVVFGADAGIGVQAREVLAPRADQVLVQVAAAGCNRADLLQRDGRYPAPAGVPSDIPGLEFSGTVVQVGELAHGLRVGDRVMGIYGGGAQAQYLLVPESICVPVPEGLDVVDAGALPEAFFTAYEALVEQGGLRRGARVLVNAVGSGVGTALVQLARALGAQVYGTTRTQAKLEQCEALGLSGGLVVEEGESPATTRERLVALAGGEFDLAVDLLGGSHLSLLLAALAPQGTVVSLGFIAAQQASLDLATIIARRLRVVGTSLRGRPNHEKAVLARRIARDLLPLFASGELRPVIDRRFPLEEAAAAYARMEENRNFGKILLLPGAPVEGESHDEAARGR